MHRTPFLQPASPRRWVALAVAALLAAATLVVSSSPASAGGSGGTASIDLDKATNGQDAAQAPGPSVPVGATVTWTYRITNTGTQNLSDIYLYDEEERHITCPIESLAAGQSMTCQKTGIARAGQYANEAWVDAWPDHGGRVTDTDWSHYFGVGTTARLDIEKLVNGQDADTAPGPNLPVGSAVTWTYVVTNTGDVALANIGVTDDRLGTIGTVSSLAPAASTTLSRTGVAVAGQYRNEGCATTTVGGQNLRDCDLAYYFGVGTTARVDLEKLVNGQDADAAPGPSVAIGSTVTWTYVITNTGAQTLTNIVVTDDRLGTIGTVSSLAPAASTTLSRTGVAVAGQYRNEGCATTTFGGQTLRDCDFAYYFGVGTASLDLEKLVNGQDADAAPGPSVAIGSTVTWNYVVTNTGAQTLTNIVVTDDRLGSIGTVSSLAPAASTTLSRTGVAVAGQYRNEGCATTAFGGQTLRDCDLAYYFGVGAARLDIEKLVNGQDADTAPGPNLPVGSAVTWTYVITNTGDVALANIVVTDDRLGSIGIISSLAPAASTTLSRTGVAVAGQYRNEGCATTAFGGQTLRDCDLAYYFGVGAARLDIEKLVNGQDADTAPGPNLPVGSAVTWTYVITNTGDVALANIVVTDDRLGSIGIISSLAPAASTTLSRTGVAVAGQYRNEGCATTTFGGQTLRDCDLAYYFGVGAARLDIEKLVNGQDADTAPGPNLPVGSAVTWTYVITNTGDVALANIVVTDDRLGSIGIISSLAPAASTTLSRTGVAVAGQYRNEGCATTTFGGQTLRDCDLAYYFGVGAARLDIEKLVNGQDADTAPGPNLPVGSAVTWTYVITNTGDVALANIVVTDDRLGSIGIISSLAPAASTTLSRTGVAVAGQYRNEGCATTTFGGQTLRDCDLAYYFGVGAARLDIEKLVNGQDADTAPGPNLPVGSAVTWTYVITNTGDVALANIVVTDDRLGSIGTISSLAPAASTTLSRTGVAVAGQYRNEGCATTTFGGQNLRDCDLAYYFGVGAASIDLEKSTNGEDADVPTGPRIPVGSTVTWTYVVTNTGAQTLSSIYLYDEEEGRISCPSTTLAAGQSMTCQETGIARAGQYANEAWVDAWPAGGARVTDTDWSHYFGVGTASLDLEKLVNGQDADTAPGPNLPVGSAVTWTYVITNTGDVALANIVVTDDRLGSIGTISSLAPAASTTLSRTGVAVAGQYRNEGCATTTFGGQNLRDCDFAYYFGVGAARLDIEKLVNGQDADTAPGPNLPVGSAVTWTYVITNTGDVALANIVVTDDRLGSIGTISSLAPAASTTLSRTGVAVAGQYRNEGCATTTVSGQNLRDCDLAYYYGTTVGRPSIDVEKYTNGEDADRPTGPRIAVGSTVTWTYVVTNTGELPLTGIYLKDNREGQITCPTRSLQPGQSMTCRETGIAQPGQYANKAKVKAWAADGTRVMDTDWSHYYGYSPASNAGVDLEAYVNGEDADRPTGPQIPVGSRITWTYVITNTGAQTLWGIYLYDEEQGHIACSGSSLLPGGSMTCVKTGIAEAGQYAAEAWVDAWPDHGAEVSDTDWIHYYGCRDYD